MDRTANTLILCIFVGWYSSLGYHSVNLLLWLFTRWESYSLSLRVLLDLRPTSRRLLTWQKTLITIGSTYAISQRPDLRRVQGLLLNYIYIYIYHAPMTDSIWLTTVYHSSVSAGVVTICPSCTTNRTHGYFVSLDSTSPSR